MQVIKAFLELCRLSNLPTCITNVLVGSALGVSASGGAMPWLTVMAVMLSISLSYAAGMALNDRVDWAIDSQLRPGRPIPSGRLTKSAVDRFIWITMTSGLGILALMGPTMFVWGMALTLSILVYNLIHKFTVVSVLFMGLCRGLVVIVSAIATGADAVPWHATLVVAAVMSVYIALVTLVARIEDRPQGDWRSWLWIVILLVGLSSLWWLWPWQGNRWLVIAHAIVLGLWLVRPAVAQLKRPGSIKLAILSWLAGICLLDGLTLTLLGHDRLALVAAGCFIVTLLLHRRILGT